MVALSHYNPDPSEGPWGRWSIPPHGGAVIASTDPTLCGSTLKHEGRRQTDRRAAYAGSRLKLIYASERSRLICQPFSRNGENSPYGMLGGIVETSASFEARSAPRSYPTSKPRARYGARGGALARGLLHRAKPPTGIWSRCAPHPNRNLSLIFRVSPKGCTPSLLAGNWGRRRVADRLHPQPASPCFYATSRFGAKYARTRGMCGARPRLRIAKSRKKTGFRRLSPWAIFGISFS